MIWYLLQVFRSFVSSLYDFMIDRRSRWANNITIFFDKNMFKFSRCIYLWKEWILFKEILMFSETGTYSHEWSRQKRRESNHSMIVYDQKSKNQRFTLSGTLRVSTISSSSCSMRCSRTSRLGHWSSTSVRTKADQVVCFFLMSGARYRSTTNHGVPHYFFLSFKSTKRSILSAGLIFAVSVIIAFIECQLTSR